MTAFDKKINQIATRHRWIIGAAAGRVYLFFSVIIPGWSFFRGIVRGGRLESIAGHSFPRGVYDIPRHAFPGVGGGGVQILFNFFWDSN